MKYRNRVLLLMLISLLLGVLSACSKEVTEKEIEVRSHDAADTEKVVIKNGDLEMQFDPITTQFTITDKRTNYVWYSNPQDASADVLATGLNKDLLNATVAVKYNTETGSPTIMSNYASSIAGGYYTYELVGDNGLKVNYSIGDIQKTYIIPQAVPESRMKEFTDKMDKGKQILTLQIYRKFDINNLGPDDNKEELLTKYPTLETEIIYEILPNAQEHLKAKAEASFAEAGYTQEEFQKDLELYSVESKSDKPIFNVSILYELKDNELKVSIPLKEIEYKSAYPIVEIRPLPYFGAGSVNDTGFIFVPEGSGAIINFNNKKVSQSNYVTSVYGYDYAVVRNYDVDEPKTNMPVFGISNKEASFLCVLEEGNSYASLEADVSNKINSFNYANAYYKLIHSEDLDVAAKSTKTIRRFQETLPDQTITQKYIFINKNDYVTMATTYREYLMKTFPQLAKKTESKVPVAVELVGALDRTKHVMGIPTRGPQEMTSYKEAKEITEKLLSYGIDDLNIKYKGWFNDGVLHKAPNKVKLINELGSKKDFKNLVTYANNNNVNLFLEANFQFVYNNSMTDNFIGIRDGAKFVNRKLVELVPFSPIFYGVTDWLYEYNLAAPSYYLKNLDSYSDKIADLGVKNIAFTDLGNILSSDYNEDSFVSREEVMKLQVEKFAELSNEGYKMMTHSGNMYAVPYSDFIVDLSLTTEGYTILDEEVPFYEIALHGLVSYAGNPMNLASDYKKNLLQTVGTGAGLYYVFMGADSFDLRDSRYTHYFSSDFEEWSEDTNELYNQIKSDLGHIYNQFIVDYKNIDQGVTMTAYEDGTKVFVNYNEKDYEYNGLTIPAMNYAVEGGNQ